MRSVWKTSYLVESQDRGSDFGSFFPPVVDILEVTVEEVLQLVICGLLIEIVPFLCGVDAQPVAISDVLQRSVLLHPAIHLESEHDRHTICFYSEYPRIP
jgi:hypothetical protein